MISKDHVVRESCNNLIGEFRYSRFAFCCIVCDGIYRRHLWIVKSVQSKKRQNTFTNYFLLKCAKYHNFVTLTIFPFLRAFFSPDGIEFCLCSCGIGRIFFLRFFLSQLFVASVLISVTWNQFVIAPIECKSDTWRKIKRNKKIKKYLIHAEALRHLTSTKY